MAITAAAGTPDQPTLDAATSNYRIKTTYSELSRGAFQQPASCKRQDTSVYQHFYESYMGHGKSVSARL